MVQSTSSTYVSQFSQAGGFNAVNVKIKLFFFFFFTFPASRWWLWFLTLCVHLFNWTEVRVLAGNWILGTDVCPGLIANRLAAWNLWLQSDWLTTVWELWVGPHLCPTKSVWTGLAPAWTNISFWWGHSWLFPMKTDRPCSFKVLFPGIR